MNKQIHFTHTLFLGILISALIISGDVLAQKKLSRKERKQQRKETKADRLFIEGEKHMMLEDFQKAFAYFEKAHELKPESGAINFKMAEILARANQHEEALEYGQKAIDSDPENKYYHLLLAEVYTKQDNPQKAAEILQSLINSSENTEHYILDLASLYLSTKQFDKALNALNQAEEYFGVMEQLTVQKQRIYLRKNNLEAALSEGEKLIKANPGNPKYILALVEILYNNNQLNKALACVLESLHQYPNQPDLHLAAYSLYQEKEEFQKAQEHLFTAFQNPDLEGKVKSQTFSDIFQKEIKTPEREALLDSLAGLMVQHNGKEAVIYAAMGNRAFAGNEKEKALSYYQQSLDIAVGDAKLVQNTISLMFELGREFEEISKYTTIGVEEFPQKPEFWFFEGTVNLALKNHQEAETAFEKSLEINNGGNKQLDLMVWGQLGDTYHALKKPEKAFDAYEKVLEQNPYNEHVLNNYAYFLSLQKKDLEKAKSMSQLLVKKFPSNSTYLDTHAWVLFQMEDFQQAKIYMKKALDNEAMPSGVMLEHYGDILFQLGAKKEAIKYWQKAQKEEDTSDMLDKKIEDRQYYE
ncbi:tetratricopeptide repeat protein [Echinicola jeungdonensis]|uniref:Tetratricopeptide repeat protein n=1 Tax=Echinicola jeungdonensis TaxID=709343 RepID=A0ABV5J7J8_9BACT|nr:tetratricopeptide repeat protein [Echinicola jeungdonensis]MDN3668062.1 tetratricopeptide repeat protein [Echinicola jeungdonensis]